MRPCEAGSIQDVLQRACDAFGRHKDVADKLGVRGSTLSESMEVSEKRPGGLGINYVDRLARFHRPSAAVFAQHFAVLAGGVFQPVSAGAGDLTSLSAIVAKEQGEAQAATIRASQSLCRKDFAAAYRETVESIEAQGRVLAKLSELMGNDFAPRIGEGAA